MQPLFKMYFDALPLSRFRTEKYFGHPGASFQETMNFFGLPGNDFLGYGCTDARKNFPFNMMLNPWSRFHYTVNLELLSLMIEYVDFSNDASFSKDILVPFAKDILDFFIHHFGVSKSNTLVISPSQVLESYQDAINPITDIGGIFWNLKRLREIDLISSQVPPELSQAWDDLHRILPNIPVEERSPGSGKVFAPAEARLASRSNIENPELYVVFPFRLFNKFSQVDKELLSQGLDLDMAYRTFAQRRDAHNRGWFPDIVLWDVFLHFGTKLMTMLLKKITGVQCEWHCSTCCSSLIATEVSFYFLPGLLNGTLLNSVSGVLARPRFMSSALMESSKLLRCSLKIAVRTFDLHLRSVSRPLCNHPRVDDACHLNELLNR